MSILINQFQKNKDFTSKKARKAAQGRSCTLRIPGVCNHDKSTVVLNHLNSSLKGWGNKSPDWWAVIACSSCHDWLDGRLDVDLGINREAEILRALFETHLIFHNEEILTLR